MSPSTVRDLLISWKPTVKTWKEKNLVPFHVRFVIFVASPALNENAAREVTVHDSVLTPEGHRYPIINSGDTIALRMAFTSGGYSTQWLHCHKSHCDRHSCHGSQTITSSRWTSSCSSLTFTITAKRKNHGEPINSGDTVSLSSNQYGSNYRLYCNTSSDTICTVQS